MPDSAGWGENDTAVVQIPIAVKSSDPTMQFDVSPFFGRVGYVYEGGALDKPLVVLRVHYRDNPYKPNSSPVVRWGFRTFQPFALYPLWDLRAEPALGSVLDGGLWPCETTAQAETRCTYPMAWTDVWHANGVSNAGQSLAWNGALVEDKREGNGLSFRRARYLDPASGRFTQPDPIGLAGGVNGYGYATGDPVNFSDPFGLCPDDKPLCHWIKATLIAAGTDIGFVAGGGAGLFTGPGALLASPAGALAGAGAGATAGAIVGEIVDNAFFSKSDHARRRAAEGRPVREGSGDVQRARESDVFVQENGRIVVRGGRGREQVFESNGEHLTAVVRSSAAHLQRLRDGILRPATSQEFEAFKALFR